MSIKGSQFHMSQLTYDTNRDQEEREDDRNQDDSAKDLRDGLH